MSESMFKMSCDEKRTCVACCEILKFHSYRGALLAYVCDNRDCPRFGLLSAASEGS